MGASGSGKSTFIKTMAGLIHTISGEISLFGHPINQCSASHLADLRKRLGVLLEKDGLIPSWTVFECLALYWRYHDLLAPDALEAHVLSLLRRFGEDPNICFRVVASLTQEERYRIALLRALQREPEFLMVDNALAVSYLPRFLKAGFEARLQERKTALLVRATPGIFSFLPKPKEQIRFVALLNGHLTVVGSWEALCQHSNPEMVKFLEGF